MKRAIIGLVDTTVQNAATSGAAVTSAESELRAAVVSTTGPVGSSTDWDLLGAKIAAHDRAVGTWKDRSNDLVELGSALGDRNMFFDLLRRLQPDREPAC